MNIDPHVFETIMLVCFGSSWPFAILKTLRTRSTDGKSLVFLSLLVIGYLSGILNKLVAGVDPVIWLYALNGSLVTIEIALYHKYRRKSQPTPSGTEKRTVLFDPKMAMLS